VTDFAALPDEDFRLAARDWLAANLPAALRGFRPPTTMRVDAGGPEADFALWKARMADIGWGVPTWPRQYGGGGLSTEQADILAEEMAAAGAFNPIGGLGVIMLGPTLLEFGSEEQKARHLPLIARGAVTWCQGFSEPGAGSDLASLRTRCEDAGDHWLVNGQKIWTSYAHHADWCFCLVRTSTERKQGGITFLLIDMKSPGVEARPITLIDGSTHFCETFFTDVRVPKENTVGEVNAGWGIAKRLLQHERNGLARLRSSDASGFDLIELARRTGAGDEPDLRARLTDHLMADHAYRLTLQRRGMEAEAGLNPTTPTSTVKNLGATIGQQRTDLAMEALGFDGLGWNGQEFAEADLEVTRLWLFSRCYTIYGGSQEVQNNITAQRELNLPTG